MPSTYSTNLALELIGTGDQAGTWGNTTNTNLGTLIEQAISGYVTQAVATGTDTTITIPNGATGVARNMYIELTGTGGTNTNLIVPSNKKLYFIFNNSTGAVTVKVSGQTGVSVPQGKKVVLASNGTDVVNGLNYIADFGSNSATITTLSATSATITNLTLTSLVISNLSIASANITTLTSSSATITNLVNTSASITTLTNNPTFSAGTANGVLYLNASKVATSGSALTFDGTTFGVTSTWGSNSQLFTNATASNLSGISARYSGVNKGYLYFDNSTSLYNLYGEAGISLAFTANAAEGMRLTSTGLGIGTSSPGARLHSVDTIHPAYFAASGTSLYTTYSRSNTTVVGYIGNGTGLIGGSNNDNFAVRAESALMFASGGATERMRLDSAGNLILGPFGGNGNAVFAGSSSPNFSNQPGTNLLIKSGDGSGTGSSYISFWTSPAGSPGTTVNTAIERLRIDLSGNLGLGVTPSAWLSAYKAVQVGQSSFVSRASNNDLYINANAYLDSGITWRYINTDAAQRYELNSGAHSWYNAPSGTAGNAITFTQAMTLDANGDLGIGTTSIPSGGASTRNVSIHNSNSAATYFKLSNGATGNTASDGFDLVMGTSSDVYLYNRENGPMIFGTNNTERARITAGGNLLVKSTSVLSYTGIGYSGLTQIAQSGNAQLACAGFFNGAEYGGEIILSKSRSDTIGTNTILQSGDRIGTIFFAGANGSGYDFAAQIRCEADGTPGASTDMPGRLMFFTTADGSATPTERARITSGGDLLVAKTSADYTTAGAEIRANGQINSASANIDFLNMYNTTAAAYRFYVSSGGTVYATNTTISAISDQRHKENVRDLDVGLDAIMALKPRKFDWKEGKGKNTKNDRGFIAQEFEQVFPDLVDEWKDPAPEGEEPYKSVRQDLIPVLVKAMQEQQAMINELKAKVAALEA